MYSILSMNLIQNDGQQTDVSHRISSI